jgi:hypothetical protein
MGYLRAQWDMNLEAVMIQVEDDESTYVVETQEDAYTLESWEAVSEMIESMGFAA